MKTNQQQSKKNLATLQKRRRELLTAHAPEFQGLAGSLLKPHQTLGNHFVQELVNGAAVQRKCACGGGCARCRLESEHRERDMIQQILQHTSGGQRLESTDRSLIQAPNSEGVREIQMGLNAHVTHSAHISALPMHLAQSMDHHTGNARDRILEKPKPEAIRAQKKIAGLDVTKSHCSCLAEIPDQIKWSQLMSKLYGDCGKDSKLKTGSDIETCVNTELAKKGIKTTVAGTTSPTGVVTVKPVPGPCGPIWKKGTEIHENVHKGHQLALEKAFGKGTPAFTAHWDNAKDWATDEVNAYSAEIPFYQAVAAYLQSICDGFSLTGAAVGGLIGGLAGAGVGFAVGGPIGALVGGLIGGIGGLLTGGFLGGR